jgi:hypothetical protein
VSKRMTTCTCRRCRAVPRSREIGDAHAIAVVLHLDIDSAWYVAHCLPAGDASHRELVDAITVWGDERDRLRRQM